MGAGETASIAEDDVERALLLLGSEVELGHDLGVGDGHVGSAIHDAWFRVAVSSVGSYASTVALCSTSAATLLRSAVNAL